MDARSGSAIGVAVVICALPSYDSMSRGVNSHRIRPLPGSIASVRPYVVVMNSASWTRPPIVTACNSIAEESTVPGSRTLRRRSAPTLCGGEPGRRRTDAAALSVEVELRPVAGRDIRLGDRCGRGDGARIDRRGARPGASTTATATATASRQAVSPARRFTEPFRARPAGASRRPRSPPPATPGWRLGPMGAGTCWVTWVTTVTTLSTAVGCGGGLGCGAGDGEGDAGGAGRAGGPGVVVGAGAERIGVPVTMGAAPAPPVRTIHAGDGRAAGPDDASGGPRTARRRDRAGSPAASARRQPPRHRHPIPRRHPAPADPAKI